MSGGLGFSEKCHLLVIPRWNFLLRRKRIVDLDKLPRGSRNSLLELLASTLEKEPWKCMWDVLWRLEKALGSRTNFATSEEDLNRETLGHDEDAHLSMQGTFQMVCKLRCRKQENPPGWLGKKRSPREETWILGGSRHAELWTITSV